MLFRSRQRNFELLPGNPIVYWLSNEYFEAFKKTSYIEQLVERKAGVVTGNDNYFLRFWFEPVFGEISFQRRPVVPNAFVMEYSESLDDKTGVGEFYLHVKQKKDKTTDTAIEGGFGGE